MIQQFHFFVDPAKLKPNGIDNQYFGDITNTTTTSKFRILTNLEKVANTACQVNALIDADFIQINYANHSYIVGKVQDLPVDPTITSEDHFSYYDLAYVVYVCRLKSQHFTNNINNNSKIITVQDQEHLELLLSTYFTDKTNYPNKVVRVEGGTKLFTSLADDTHIRLALLCEHHGALPAKIVFDNNINNSVGNIEVQNMATTTHDMDRRVALIKMENVLNFVPLCSFLSDVARINYLNRFYLSTYPTSVNPNIKYSFRKSKLK